MLHKFWDRLFRRSRFQKAEENEIPYFGSSQAKIVPLDPFKTLAPSAEVMILEWLRKAAPEFVRLEVRTHDSPQFIDAGENFFEVVACPGCKSPVRHEWWSEWMDEDYDGRGFRLYPRILPCCGRKFALNELNYDLNHAFAVWEARIHDIGIALIPSSDLERLEQVLGTPMTVVYAHY